jgi:CRP-like cAMP-binding protein
MGIAPDSRGVADYQGSIKAMDRDPATVHCTRCPLRMLPAFVAKNDREITQIAAFKSGHRRLGAKITVIAPGDANPDVFTLFNGWAFRYKLLPNGDRQILNFLLPGDIVGFQASLLAAAEHGVETLTPVELCVFPRRKLWPFFRAAPELAYQLAWLGAREEGIVDEHLASVGQRGARERLAALLLSLYRRCERLDLVQEGSFVFPLGRQHLADALGLSLVHTTKSWASLRRMGLLREDAGRLTILNPRLTERFAEYYERDRLPRPIL